MRLAPKLIQVLHVAGSQALGISEVDVAMAEPLLGDGLTNESPPAATHGAELSP